MLDGRRSAAWGGALGLVACTVANPAYEEGEGGSTAGSSLTTGGPTSTASTPTPTDDPPVDTSASATSTSTGVEETSESGTSTGPDEPPSPPVVGPYHEPLVQWELSDPSYEDDDPSLTGDMLEIYFATLRPGGPGMDDIWVSRREDVTAPWGPPEPAPGLNSDQRDHTPEVSLDGLTMMLSSTRTTFTFFDEDVFVSTRPNRDAEWEEPVRVAEMSTPNRDVCPFVTADGRETYGCTGSEGFLDLVRFERDGAGDPWSEPTVIAALQTPGLDCGAWVDASTRTIAFFSDREGLPGSTDLYVAMREDVDQLFEMPIPLEELNSPWLDDDPWMSQDGRFVYFASDRPGTNPQDIYMAERQ